MTLLTFAFGAGLLSPLNPCGFALLPAFLAYYLGDDDGDGSALAHGFAVGGAVSAGFAGVFIAAGLLISAGLRPLITYIPWAAVVIGAGLVLLGMAMAAGRHVGVQLGERFRPGSGRGVRPMVLFGAAYATSSLACTLAVLLAVVAQALSARNPVQLVAVFLAYGAGAATLLTGLTVSAALAKGALTRVLRRALPVMDRVGGVVLVAAGIYLISYWLPAVRGGGRGRRPVSPLPGELSTRLTGFVASHQTAFALLAATLAVVGVAFAVHARRRSDLSDSPIEPRWEPAELSELVDEPV